MSLAHQDGQMFDTKDEKAYEKAREPGVVAEPAFSGEPAKARDETLHRGLNSRQISMIAIGGAVGTGLMIGSGTALQRGGSVCSSSPLISSLMYCDLARPVVCTEFSAGKTLC